MEKIFPENLDKAVEVLKQGGILVFPTETSYGLGCDATDQKAVDKIFKIKNRPAEKALLAVVPSVEMAREYLVWNDLLENLAGKYWPGPLTIVGQAKGNLAKGVVGADGTVAIRVSAHPAVKYLSEKLGKPLVATSANISGDENIYDSAEIFRIFDKLESAPDAAIDAGTLPEAKPTTVVSVTGNQMKILRQGGLQIS